MSIKCVWEHNGEDSLLYAVEHVGAFTRGASKAEALNKMAAEAAAYSAWNGDEAVIAEDIEIVQDAPCGLDIRDADSDVLFDGERAPLTMEEYLRLKALALKSAADFHALYESVPDKGAVLSDPRRTFYGEVPTTAKAMYEHTRSVNEYYFAEIDVAADNEGSIYECRKRGFEALEKQGDFLNNRVIEGSYGECWSLRKVLRRFIWHDRIHAKAMYKGAVKKWGREAVPDVFIFSLITYRGG